jgi:hypothetical protein
MNSTYICEQHDVRFPAEGSCPDCVNGQPQQVIVANPPTVNPNPPNSTCNCNHEYSNDCPKHGEMSKLPQLETENADFNPTKLRRQLIQEWRRVFAAHALQGIIARGRVDATSNQAATDALEYADALLARLGLIP